MCGLGAQERDACSTAEGGECITGKRRPNLVAPPRGHQGCPMPEPRLLGSHCNTSEAAEAGMTV